MDTVYLISLIVGGFFVLLSIFGGDADADSDADFDVDTDADIDIDTDIDADAHMDLGAGPGFIDLLSLRTLFLFAAFFGLTGSLLTWTGTGEPLAAITATAVGLVVGFVGNYVIKRVGYAHISSDVTTDDMKGLTGRVLIPFSGDERGKISLIVKGSEVRLPARSFDPESAETFNPGDEIVVVARDGTTAEVVKPT